LKLCRARSDAVLYPLRGALLVAILMCATGGFAQKQATGEQAGTASITGKLTIAAWQKTTDNLAGITVKLTGPAPGSTSKTTVTDFKGSYEFTRLGPGSYTLEASVEGFQAWTAAVTLEPGQTATEDVALQITSV
jgi:hypothetical protein